MRIVSAKAVSSIWGESFNLSDASVSSEGSASSESSGSSSCSSSSSSCSSCSSSSSSSSWSTANTSTSNEKITVDAAATYINQEAYIEDASPASELNTGSWNPPAAQVQGDAEGGDPNARLAAQVKRHQSDLDEQAPTTTSKLARLEESVDALGQQNAMLSTELSSLKEKHEADVAHLNGKIDSLIAMVLHAPVAAAPAGPLDDTETKSCETKLVEEHKMKSYEAELLEEATLENGRLAAQVLKLQMDLDSKEDLQKLENGNLAAQVLRLQIELDSKEEDTAKLLEKNNEQRLSTERVVLQLETELVKTQFRAQQAERRHVAATVDLTLQIDTLTALTAQLTTTRDIQEKELNQAQRDKDRLAGTLSQCQTDLSRAQKKAKQLEATTAELVAQIKTLTTTTTRMEQEAELKRIKTREFEVELKRYNALVKQNMLFAADLTKSLQNNPTTTTTYSLTAQRKQAVWKSTGNPVVNSTSPFWPTHEFLKSPALTCGGVHKWSILVEEVGNSEVWLGVASTGHHLKNGEFIGSQSGAWVYSNLGDTWTNNYYLPGYPSYRKDSTVTFTLDLTGVGTLSASVDNNKPSRMLYNNILSAFHVGGFVPVVSLGPFARVRFLGFHTVVKP
jgi:hypothetical protein